MPTRLEDLVEASRASGAIAALSKPLVPGIGDVAREAIAQANFSRLLDYRSPESQLFEQFAREQQKLREFGAFEKLRDTLRFVEESQSAQINKALMGITHGLSSSFNRAHHGLTSIGPTIDEILRAAERSIALPLNDALAAYRSPFADLAAKLTIAHSTSHHWGSVEYLTAFNEASALANLAEESSRITRSLSEANAAAIASIVNVPGTVADYGLLLRSGGLDLPHWPDLRLLRRATTSRSVAVKLRANRQPQHVTQAFGLIYRYEITLRQMLDLLMQSTYGEDWAEERLHHCKCGDLLGRRVTRDDPILDHADYVHYGRIVGHPEHFEAIFFAAFDSPEEATRLFDSARTLRAAVAHGRSFSKEDLKALRLVFRTLHKAMVALLDAHMIDFDN